MSISSTARNSRHNPPAPKTSRTKLGLLLLLGLVVLGLFIGGAVFYIAPHRQAQRLGMAVAKENYGYLLKNLDYPALRVNMANNLYAIISQNARAQHRHFSVAMMRMAANNGAAHLATPEGAENILRNTLPQLGTHPTGTRYTTKFLSWNRYAILVTGPGGRIRVVLYRVGLLTWKVGDIAMLPTGMHVADYPRTVPSAKVATEAAGVKIMPTGPDAALTTGATASDQTPPGTANRLP